MTKWQTLLIAAVVLPVAGFTAGSVMSSQAETPPDRDEIVVPAGSPGTDDPTSAATSRTTAPSSSPTSEPTS